jgi:hypothetical protein
VSNPFDPTQQHPQNPEGSGDEPTQFVPPQAQPGQQQPFGQQPPGPQPGQPAPEQPWPGQQPYAGQPYPGQQPYGGQPYPGAPQQPGGYPAAGFGGATPPPGMPPAPGGYPGQPGGQPPSGGNKKLLIGGGLAAVALIAIIAVVLVITLGGSDSKSKKQSPPPAASAKELLVTQADFPTLSGGEFDTSGPDTDTSSSDVTSDNPKCKDLIDGGKSDDPSVDQRSAELDAEDSSSSGLNSQNYTVEVKKTIDPDYTTNFDKILSSCNSFSIKMNTDHVEIQGDVTMKPLTVGGVDGDYKGVEMDMTMRPADSSSDVTINAKMHILLAVDRSVSYSATYQTLTSEGSAEIGSDVDGDLASLLNKQRQKILDAK